ncbi:unnamed protein product [Rotaria magnacalcarata]
MDKWIADNIDQEVEDGRAIRNNYNQSRRLSRIQTFSMNKHVASSREDHLSFEDLFTHMDDEPMEVNETSSVLSNQSAYDANVIDPMNNSPDESDSDSGDNDDDDDDDSIYMLDSFDESESSEDETEDNEEQRYLTTANDQLHSYTANKTSDVCIQLLKSILVRLYDEINGYKKQILKESEEVNKQSNDIPFASCYQNLLNYDNNFISLLFHIDGIGLFKSSKLKLWLFSTSIIELPPRLRYKRCNLPVVSVWVGYKEPNIHMWLDKSIIVGSVPVKYNIFYYGIIADCPALALILNFINHTGYFCCFYCFIRGQHDRRCRKRQYIYSDTVCTRDPTSFNNHSHSAESNKLKVYGHRGRSILDEIIDVPLPHSIICDYQHVTLLRHFRDVMKAISCSLPTKVRKQIEQNAKRTVTSRGRVIAHPKRFTPTTPSPLQLPPPQLPLSPLLQTTADPPLNPKAVDLNRKRKRLVGSKVTHMPSLTFDDESDDEADDDSDVSEDDDIVNQPAKKIMRTTSSCPAFDKENIDITDNNERINMSISLDQFKSSSADGFQLEVLCGSVNLLDVCARNYGDYARQILRILYTTEELCSSILPTDSTHFARKPLDIVRFRKFHDAIRNKYRIASNKYDEFYHFCLRRKLVDFLCDERKRQIKRKEKLTNNRQQQQQPTHLQEAPSHHQQQPRHDEQLPVHDQQQLSNTAKNDSSTENTNHLD